MISTGYPLRPTGSINQSSEHITRPHHTIRTRNPTITTRTINLTQETKIHSSRAKHPTRDNRLIQPSITQRTNSTQISEQLHRHTRTKIPRNREITILAHEYLLTWSMRRPITTQNTSPSRRQKTIKNINAFGMLITERLDLLLQAPQNAGINLPTTTHVALAA